MGREPFRHWVVLIFQLAMAAASRGGPGGWTVIPLDQPGGTESRARGVSGTRQVGNGPNGACIWSGTPGSRVDLNPAGVSAEALAIDGTEQVGNAYVAIGGFIYTRASLWHGT